MVDFYDKYDLNKSVTKESVSGEIKTIPNNNPYTIFLNHIPRDNNSVSISDGGVTSWTEVDSEPSAEGEFQVLYSEFKGQILFSSADSGKEIQIDYDACGTVVWAETYSDGREGINKIQNAILDHEDAPSPHNGHLKKSGDTITGNMTYASGAVLKKTSSGGTTYTIIDDDAKVHRAVYNDIAELMFKFEDVEPGDVLVSKLKDGSLGVKKSEKQFSRGVVGVYSDTYGFYIGGENVSEKENLKSYAPVGISGRVKVKAIGPVNEFDLLAASEKVGVAQSINRNNDKELVRSYRGSIIGKALESLLEGEERRIWMLIMNC